LAKCILQGNTNNSNDDDNGGNGDDNDSPPQEIPPRCNCGKCRHMEKTDECVCCKMRPCTTTTEVFHDTYLNRNVLAVGNINRSDYMGDEIEFSPSNYRKAAYRQCIMLHHGRGNIKVAPSCAVLLL